MTKQKFQITNWSTYNKALKQRGSLTIWLDDSTITAWTDKTTPERRGRPLQYLDMAITTVLMMKRVFGLSLRALQGFVDSIFKLMGQPLRCPDYSLISKREKIIGHLEKPRRLHFLFLKTLVYCSIWVFCEHIKYKKQTISFGPDLISRRDLPNMRFFEVPS